MYYGIAYSNIHFWTLDTNWSLQAAPGAIWCQGLELCLAPMPLSQLVLRGKAELGRLRRIYAFAGDGSAVSGALFMQMAKNGEKYLDIFGYFFEDVQRIAGILGAIWSQRSMNGAWFH